jgi:hypothetical protein
MNKILLANELIRMAHSKPGFSSSDYMDQKDLRKDYSFYKRYADKNRSYKVYNVLDCLDRKDETEILIILRQNRYAFEENASNSIGKLRYIAGQYHCTEYQVHLNHILRAITEL